MEPNTEDASVVVSEAIRTFVLNEVLFGEVADVAGAEPLLTGGLVSSFYLLQLAAHLEDTFGVRIPDEDLQPEVFDTIDELTAYVVARLP
jgi:acyl carrier protein